MGAPWLPGTMLALLAEVARPTVHVASFGDGLAAATLRRELSEALSRRDLASADQGSASTARFEVGGEVVPRPAGELLRVVVRERGRTLVSFEAVRAEGELLLPIVLPMAVGRAIDERLHPPAPPSEEERRILAELDLDPPIDPGELDPCVLGCCYPVGPELGSWDVEADLRQDFAEYCRVEPRRHRRSRDEPVDLRPVCRRGPVLGYLRPWTWVAGAATVGAGAATTVSFGLRAAGWSSAGLQLGYHRRLGASLGAWGTASAALTGALLSTTIGLVISDRRRAARFIREQKQLRAAER
ncbi:MAG: hypothetical protein H6712_25555 [Myxococcales bacterium]|nr:hypothetical protein [Myxococcales bacterium]